MTTLVQKVDINCKGRDMNGNEVLTEAIPVTISLHCKKPPLVQNFSIAVEPDNCPYNTGGHSQRCKASHAEEDRFGRGVKCSFSFKYPYILRYKPNWKPPEAIAEAFRIAQNIQ